MIQTLEIGRSGLASAAAQQVLIRLFRRWCCDKRCAECPLANHAAAAAVLLDA